MKCPKCKTNMRGPAISGPFESFECPNCPTRAVLDIGSWCEKCGYAKTLNGKPGLCEGCKKIDIGVLK
jgi:hypothetical protein